MDWIRQIPYTFQACCVHNTVIDKIRTSHRLLPRQFRTVLYPMLIRQTFVAIPQQFKRSFFCIEDKRMCSSVQDLNISSLYFARIDFKLVISLLTIKVTCLCQKETIDPFLIGFCCLLYVYFRKSDKYQVTTYNQTAKNAW